MARYTNTTRVPWSRFPGSLLFGLVATVQWVALAEAGPAGEQADGERLRVVMIAEEADADASTGAIAAVSAQLSDIDVELRIAWVPEFAEALRAQYAEMRRIAIEHDAALAFWVDVSMTEEVFLYIAEPGGGRILVRSVEFTEETGASRFDVLAIIVRNVVEAITEGGEIGVRPPAQVEPQPQPPPPEPPVAPTFDPPVVEPEEQEPGPGVEGVLELQAAYAVSVYDREPTWLHGARVGIAVAVADWLWIGAAYRIQPPFDKSNELVDMEFRPHPFEVGLSARVNVENIVFDAGILVLNDPLSWSVRSKSPGISPESERFRWLVAAAPCVSVAWSPYGFYRFFVAASADIYFNESPSVVSMSSGQVDVTEPLQVRPYVQIGAAFVLR